MKIMKKYFIVLVILFILMGVFSMDILGRSIIDVQASMVGQTNYRINIVKGVVAVANINKTFDCYIAGETVIYPNIPTFSRDPKLQVGDEVTIEFINGCRETPAILAPEDIRERPDTTLPGITRYIYIVFEDFVSSKVYINSYTLDGVYVTQWEIEFTELYYGENVLCVDVDENVYTITANNHSIKKRDSGGTLVLTKTETNYIYNIATGPDGYIYTLEFDSGFNDGYISKRNASDLVSVDTLIIDASGAKAYDGFAIDSDSNFYVTNDTDGRYEKWTWLGGLIASRNSTSSINDGGLGIAGIKLGSLDRTGRHPITIPLALDANETDGVLEDILRPMKVGTISGFLLYFGQDNIGGEWIGKYTSDLTKVWTLELPAGATGPGSICAYPF